jgi:hypothetical protein
MNHKFYTLVIVILGTIATVSIINCNMLKDKIKTKDEIISSQQKTIIKMTADKILDSNLIKLKKELL